MKDKKGFCKLFGINIPDYDHFDYYIEQYSKTEKFKNIYKLIELYKKGEEEVGDLYNYRMKKSNIIIDFLKTTQAYSILNMNDLHDLPTYNGKLQENKLYISIDIRTANFRSLKEFDVNNELSDTYEEFLDKFDLPEVFKYSKQFRQFIFGNINPKRQGKIQRQLIEGLILSNSHLNMDIISIKNDEVIFCVNDFDIIKELVVDESIYKIKLFTTEIVKDFNINTIYSNIDYKPLYKEFKGCNGNLFFIYLKQYILKEDIEIRDLYFRMDNQLALWYVDGMKITI